MYERHSLTQSSATRTGSCWAWLEWTPLELGLAGPVALDRVEAGQGQVTCDLSQRMDPPRPVVCLSCTHQRRGRQTENVNGSD